MATFRILRILAIRNIFTHKVSSLIVGGIIFFGTLLVVLGTSVLDTIDDSLTRSITSSLAGHLQVYSKDASDDLALFGGGFMGEADLGTIDDFKNVREKIEALPNVKAVVPMGIALHTDVPQSGLDLAITRLREAVDNGNALDIATLAHQIREMSHELEGSILKLRDIAADKEKADKRLESVRRIQSEEFWRELQSQPEQTLTFLDSKLAPLAEEAEMLWMRNVGTDLDRFPQLFDRFEIVEGTTVQSGKRGILLAERFYEGMAKNHAARDLDKIYEGVTIKGQSIAKTPKLKDLARRLPGQYRRVTFEISPDKVEEITTILAKEFPDTDREINDLVETLLTVDDQNIRERFAIFYEHVAPRIRLYKLKVGDTITLRAYTKSGYIKSLNIKVHGIYRFKSLERSELAGAQNLMDMVSFRELHGQMTEETRLELASIRDEVDADDLGGRDIEAALFGGPDDIVESEEDMRGFDVDDVVDQVELAAMAPVNDSFDPATIDDGLAIHAAVILENPTKIPESQAAIAALSESEGLGLQVVDWRTASGMVGQLIIVIRIVLYVAIFIIFLVALAIINNSMVMATLERTNEIGTMRALGAQRKFVVQVFLLETVVLGLSAGFAGAIAGVLGVWALGNVGIPAASDIMVFLFSGPRLFPVVGADNVVFALAVIIGVSLLSTLYPAMLGARILPVVAMQAKE